ncbi:MAG: hypothetical protein E6Q99_04585, partial [Elusimicrobia bacterium]
MGTPKHSLLKGVDVAVDAAVARLVSLDVVGGRHRISMPIALCTGSMVDVSVWAEPGGTFMVSDDGTAHFEATLAMVSERTFGAVARAKIAPYGAAFDGHSMLFIRVEPGRLHGAIVAMASLIKEVVDEAIARAARAKSASAFDTLYERIGRAFPNAEIQHHAGMIGASTAEYEVDAAVRTERGLLVFDMFTKDPISIAATFTKLSDLSRLDAPPRLVAVT